MVGRTRVYDTFCYKHNKRVLEEEEDENETT